MRAWSATGRRAWHLAQKVGHRGVAAVIALLADLAQQSAAGQARIGDDPLAQISLERFKPPVAAACVGHRPAAPSRARFAHCLVIDADPARDRRDAQPLPMRIQDRDELPSWITASPSRPREGSSNGALSAFPERAREGGFTPGEFPNGESGEHHSGNDNYGTMAC